MFESKTDPITLTHAHKLADVVCVIFAPALAFLHLVQRHRPHPACAWLRPVSSHAKKKQAYLEQWK